MNIRIATTDEDIAACYPVMRELRPHLLERDFVARVRRQEGEGYRLVMLEAEDGTVAAVAGFRVGENLAYGGYLYVDDLVTAPAHRSEGYGARLLAWLRARAAEEGCRQLRLDSGLQREGAHRFYEREGMTRAGYHFIEAIGSGAGPDDDAGRC